MRETNWNVLTAGPSAGKSSTLREFSFRGYTTAPEASRIVIDQAISEGIHADDVRDEIQFQQRVVSTDYGIESTYSPEECLFLDRSLADNIAYMRHYDKMIDTADIIRRHVENRYANVFILDRLEMQDDHARDEDEAEAAAIHETIIETYEDLGYTPVHIPVTDVASRANMILEESSVPCPNIETERDFGQIQLHND